MRNSVVMGENAFVDRQSACNVVAADVSGGDIRSSVDESCVQSWTMSLLLWRLVSGSLCGSQLVSSSDWCGSQLVSLSDWYGAHTSHSDHQ